MNNHVDGIAISLPLCCNCISNQNGPRKPMTETPDYDDLNTAMQADARVDEALSAVFGPEIVEQARLIDVTDLNLNDDMVRSITDGLNRLKQTRHDPEGQTAILRTLSPGEQLLLCMWIREMELLEKIRK